MIVEPQVDCVVSATMLSCIVTARSLRTLEVGACEKRVVIRR